MVLDDDNNVARRQAVRKLPADERGRGVATAWMQKLQAHAPPRACSKASGLHPI